MKFDANKIWVRKIEEGKSLTNMEFSMSDDLREGRL